MGCKSPLGARLEAFKSSRRVLSDYVVQNAQKHNFSIFLYISFRIIKNCINQDDELIKISLCGLSALLVFQTFIHVGVNTNLIPTTGMTLPYISYGGSSIISVSIISGIILNLTKRKLS